VVRLRSEAEPAAPADVGVVLEVRGDDLFVSWASGDSSTVRLERLRVMRIWPVDADVDQLPREDLTRRRRWTVEQWQELGAHFRS
jgi:hypothetical protein